MLFKRVGGGDRFVRPKKLRGKRNIHDSCEVSNYSNH